jgi:multiple sugar transport system ATP-binding protein
MEDPMHNLLSTEMGVAGGPAGIRFEGVSKTFPDGTVAIKNFSLDIHAGEFMILVGPSGCGKTTALRMVAGLEEISDGSIYLGDRLVNDTEPEHRDIAMVFQNYALFPHMSVRDNMSFPLRMRGFPKHEIIERVNSTAELLELSPLLNRKPRELSGGQRQRVAMGRAIVRHPQAFLLDEPLSNLDAKLRTQMRTELARLHRRLGVTTLYVTHDQVEAMTLGSRVAVMRGGILHQVGTPKELYARPANSFVARFIGSPAMNLLPGRLHEGRLTVDGVANGASGQIAGQLLASSGSVTVGIRPEAWSLTEPATPGFITLRGEVDVIEELGSLRLLYVRPEPGMSQSAIDEDGRPVDTIVVQVSESLPILVGERREFHAPSELLHLFDEQGQTIRLPAWRL